MSKVLDIETKLVVIEKKDEVEGVNVTTVTSHWNVQLAKYNDFYLYKADYSNQNFSTGWNIIRDLGEDYSALIAIVEHHNKIFHP